MGFCVFDPCLLGIGAWMRYANHVSGLYREKCVNFRWKIVQNFHLLHIWYDFQLFFSILSTQEHNLNIWDFIKRCISYRNFKFETQHRNVQHNVFTHRWSEYGSVFVLRPHFSISTYFCFLLFRNPSLLSVAEKWIKTKSSLSDARS